METPPTGNEAASTAATPTNVETTRPPGLTAPAQSTSSVAPISLAPAAGAQANSASRDGDQSLRDYREYGYGAFAPLLLLVLCALAWPSFQCYQLISERQTFATIHANQTKQFDDSVKLRTALDQVARDTALLAANGNASAKLIVDELARRGVTIDPSKPTLTPPTKSGS